MNKPVKVFIMLGEANMVGAGQTSGEVLGTLEYTVKEKKRFTHLVDDVNKDWRERSDVRYVAVADDMVVMRNEWMAVKEEHNFFGPELQFGYILGELLEEPVLLLKACSGHQSLGGDLLPPGSQRHEFGDWVYAGYGDSPRRWPIGTEPGSTTASWYAGHAYDATLNNIKTVLSSIGDYYPGAKDYEISGIAFWHGDSDRRDTGYAVKYQRNLRSFITSVRHDLDVPEAKVAIASLGQRGEEMMGDTLQIFQSQMAMDILFPDFRGNVMAVDTRSSWRTPYLPGFEGDDNRRDVAHYGNNAETVMEVGNALGMAMAKLLHGTNQPN